MVIVDLVHYADVAVEEIRVDALKERVSARDPDVAGSVVTRERLQTAGGAGAADVLRGEPGVQVQELGGSGAPSTAALRGATAADTPVYLAGVRLNDDVVGTADLSSVPLWLLDRIEVFRGNAPLDADRYAPGGAIFLEPRRPTRNGGGVGATAGSFGLRQGWAYASWRGSHVRGLVGVGALRAVNDYSYRDDRGTLFDESDDTSRLRTNADVHAYDGWGVVRVDAGAATVDIVVNGVSREQGVPRLALLPSREARNDSQRLLTSVTARIPWGPAEVFAMESRTTVVAARSRYHDPLMELSLSTRELDLSGARVEQTLASDVRVSTLRVRPSLSLASERIERTPLSDSLTFAQRLFARAAGAAEWEATEHLTFRALASEECHATRPSVTTSEGRTCDVLEATGRGGASVHLENMDIFATVGRYVRVPSLGETYGLSAVVHGNPQLVPETGLTGEVGARAHTPKRPIGTVHADIFGFVRSADNLVAYQRAAQGFVVPYNVGQARVVGLEILGGGELRSIQDTVMHLDLAATLLDPRDTSFGRTTRNDVLPFRSRLVVAPRAGIAHTTKGPMSSVGGNVQAVYQSSRYVDAAGLGVVGQQISVDASVDSVWWETVRGQLRVADIFDAQRTDILGFPLPGRSAFFTLEATW